MKMKAKRIVTLLLAMILTASVPIEVYAEQNFSTGQQSETYLIEEEIVDSSKEDISDMSACGASEIETESDIITLNGADSGGLSVTGSDSFGEMLGEILSEKISEQQANNGCNIFSVEMNGTTAVVEFETIRDAELVIAIYEEDGIRMLASGKERVKSGDTTVEVHIDTDQMPQYYYLRAYLVIPKTLETLCSQYETPNYTKEMQDFFARTTDDFDQDRVLNIDDDKTNNYLVYNDSVVRVKENKGANELTSSDDNARLYQFNNIDSSISDLKPGDILSYEHTDGTLLIVVVDSITVSDDGRTASVTGKDSSLEDVFEYIRIDVDADRDNATVDNSNLEEGVSYIGTMSDEDFWSYDPESGINNEGAADVDAKLDIKHDVYDLDKKIAGGDNNNVKVKGSVSIGIEGELKINATHQHRSIELKLEGTVNAKISIDGTLKNKPIQLGYFAFSPMAGVYISFTPEFIVEVSGEVELSGTLSFCVGKSYDSDSGVNDLTTTPKAEFVIKAEVSVFVGISFTPKVTLLTDKIAFADVKATVGLRAKGSKTLFNATTEKQDKVHLCKNCISGDINVEVKGSFEAKFLNNDKYSVNADITLPSIKITDWYYSFDKNDFGWTTCPYFAYPVCFIVIDEYGKPVNKAKISNLKDYIVRNGNQEPITFNITDSSGTCKGFQKAGDYEVEVSADGVETVTKKYSVDENGVTVNIWLTGLDTVEFNVTDTTGNPVEGALISELIDFSMSSDGTKPVNSVRTDSKGIAKGYQTKGKKEVCVKAEGYENETKSYEVKKGSQNKITITLKKADQPEGEHYPVTYIITDEEGNVLPGATISDLSGFILNADDMSTVESIITDDSGKATGFQTAGTKTAKISSKGFKVKNAVYTVEEKDNTVEIMLTKEGESDNTSDEFLSDNRYGFGGSNSAFIKQDGSLWMWGNNSNGALGIHTEISEYLKRTPIEVMNGVKSVSIGNSSTAIIKEDDSLWTCGFNMYGELGTGDTETHKSPVKIMDNVAKVEMETGVSGALQKDGSLWIWGDNTKGQLGNVERTGNVFPPYNVMNEVADFGIGGSFVAAVKNDGSLWLWGHGFSAGYSPRKVDDGIKEVSCDSVNCMYIKEDGSLWFIGSYPISNNTVKGFSYNEPLFIADNVKSCCCTWGRLAYIDNNGNLWQWGQNSSGLVGDGTTEFIDAPLKIAENVVSVHNTSSISAYTTSDGYLWTWGTNNSCNVLGYEEKGESSLVPRQIVNLLTERVESQGEIDNLLSGTDDGMFYDDPSLDWVSCDDIVVDDISQDGAGSVRRAHFTGLYPYSVYNFYLLKDRSAADLLYANNLNYIIQGITDGNGDMNISYYPRESSDNEDPFVVGFWDNSENEIEEGDLTEEEQVPEGLWMPDISSPVYDGTAQIPDIRIYDGGTLLSEKTDYKISVKNNKNAYTRREGDDGFNASKAPQVMITMSGNYTGKKTVYYTIDPLPIDGVMFDAYLKKSGKSVKPVLAYNCKNLKEKTDYTVETEGDNYIISGTGNYTGTRIISKAEDTLNKSGMIPMAKAGVSKITNQTYKGTVYSVSDIEELLEGHVTYKGTKLVCGTDYEVARVIGGKNTGKMTVVLQGLKNPDGTAGSFCGEKRVKISIVPYSLKNQGIQVTDMSGSSDISVQYVKDGANPNIKVTYFGMTLKQGRDYTLSYSNNKAVARSDSGKKAPIVTVIGKGNFKDKLPVNFTINENKAVDDNNQSASIEIDKDISKAVIKLCDQEYTGKEIKITGSFQIRSAVIGKAKNALSLSTDGGKTGDFIVVPGSYINNINTGTAKVTFKGINGFYGYKTVTYKIKSKSLINWWRGLFK